MGQGGSLAVLDNIEQTVERMETVSDMRAYLEDLKKLKALLDAARMFNEKARKYAQLEAATYVRIVELGYAGEVPNAGYQRAVVEWFATLSPQEREDAVARCGERGVTIKALWKDEVHEPGLMERELDALRMSVAEAIDEFDETGEVVLNDYFKHAERPASRIPRDIVASYKDDARRRLREHGGHGLGDDEGTYMTKEKAGEKSKEIVMTKVESIVADVERLKEFIDGAEPFELQIESKSRTNYGITAESTANVMLLLCGIGTPYMKSGYPWTRAKVYARILVSLGITPAALFRDMLIFSKQLLGSEPGWEHGAKLDLTMFGWSEQEAQALADAIRPFWKMLLSPNANDYYALAGQGSHANAGELVGALMDSIKEES